MQNQLAITRGPLGRRDAIQRCVSRFLYAITLAAVGLCVQVPAVRAADIVQTYYTPLPEEDLLTAMNAISAIPDTSVYSVTGFSTTRTGTLVYYDHWEDGYENDVTAPVQSTTLVLGDGYYANGAPPDCAVGDDACDNLTAGRVVIWANDVPADGSRDPNNLLYDARDYFATSELISVTRGYWPTPNTRTVISGAVEMYATQNWGLSVVVPAGVDTTGSMFEDARLFVQAADDQTRVEVDSDGDGTVDSIQFLNAGENLTVVGVSTGATAIADKKIQGVLVSGDVGTTFEQRSIALIPQERWGTSYLLPVSSPSATDPMAIIVFNPDTNPLSVTAECSNTTHTLTVPAGDSVIFVPTAPTNPPSNSTTACSTNSAVRLSASQSFNAIAIMDNEDTSHDWGFTALPEPGLRTKIKVGLGFGRDPTSTVNPTENGSPVWITAPSTVQVQVDYNGDGYDEAGQGDETITINALESVRIYDDDPTYGDGDQTGMLITSLDSSVRLAAAWGEDPSVASPGQPGLDLGTTVPNVPPVVVAVTQAAGCPAPGDTIPVQVVVSNAGDDIAQDVYITNIFESPLNYELNSTTKTNGGGTVSIPDDGTGTPFPLDNNPATVPAGVNLGDINPGETVTLNFLLRAPSPYPNNEPNAVQNTVTVTSDAGAFTVTDIDYFEICLNLLELTKTSVVSGGDATVDPGETITYTMQPRVPGKRPTCDVTLTDPVPAFTTFQSASPAQDFGPDPLIWDLGCNTLRLDGENTNTLSRMVASPMMLGDGEQITVELEVILQVPGTSLVTAPTLSDTGTGADAINCSAPSPATDQTVIFGTPIYWTWTCDADLTGTGVGEVVFSTTPSGTNYSYEPTTSNSVLVTPDIQFSVTANNPLGSDEVVNTATLDAFGAQPVQATVTDPVDNFVADFGDLPVTSPNYGTAAHYYDETLALGACTDQEPAYQGNMAASYDDDNFPADLPAGTVTAASMATGSSSNTSSLSFNHTPGTGNNRLLMAAVAVGATGSGGNPPTVSSVTFGSTPLSLVGSRTSGSGGDNDDVRVYLYSLVNPSESTASLVVSLSGAGSIVAGATTFTGVHQVSPLGALGENSGAGGTASVSVTSATDEAVIGVVAWDENPTITIGAGQSSTSPAGWEQDGAGIGPLSGASTTEAGSATVTHSYTSNNTQDWAILAIPIKPSSAVPGGCAGATGTITKVGPETSAESSSGTSLTFSHEVNAGDDRVLVVGVGVGAPGTSGTVPDVTGVTYGGTALTQLDEQANGGEARSEIWYLKETGINTGTADVVVTLSGSGSKAAGAVTYADVDQTTSFGTAVKTTGSTTTPSVNVSSATGELVYGVLAVDSDPTLGVGAGQAELWNHGISSNILGSISSTEPGALSVAHSYTQDESGQGWALIAVPLKPATVSVSNNDEDAVTFIGHDGANQNRLDADVSGFNGTGQAAMLCGYLDGAADGVVDGTLTRNIVYTTVGTGTAVGTPGANGNEEVCVQVPKPPPTALDTAVNNISITGMGSRAQEATCQTFIDNSFSCTITWRPSFTAAVTTYARFRLTSDPDFFSNTSPSPTGAAANGEVEDYDLDMNPTSAVIGKVEIIAAPVEGVVAGMSENGLSQESLAWFDPELAEAIDPNDLAEIDQALMDYFDPDGDGDVAILRWETLEERGTIGFYVERQQLGEPSWDRINGALLPALIDAPLGGEYWLADPEAASGIDYLYRLIEQEAWGSTKSYGPYLLRFD